MYKTKLTHKLFKPHHAGFIHIWAKDSIVGGGSILLEYITNNEQFYMFVNKKHKNDLLINPYKAIDLLSNQKAQVIKNTISKDKLFYYNGHEVKVGA